MYVATKTRLLLYLAQQFPYGIFIRHNNLLPEKTIKENQLKKMIGPFGANQNPRMSFISSQSLFEHLERCS